MEVEVKPKTTTLASLDDISQYLITPAMPESNPLAFGPAYVAFVFPDPEKADYKSLIRDYPAVAEATPYLHANGSVKPLEPLQFMYQRAHRFWGCFDDKNNIRPGSYAEVRPAGKFAFIKGKVVPFDKTDDSHGHAKIDECIYGAGLVLDGENIVPATMRLKKAQCRFGDKAISALEDATNPDVWMKRGTAFKVSAALPHPWTRFSIRGRGWLQKPKYAGGYSYYAADGEVMPTSIENGERILNFIGTARGKAQFVAVMDAFNDRIAKMREGV